MNWLTASHNSPTRTNVQCTKPSGDVIGDGADVRPSYLQVFKPLGNNNVQYQFDLAQARNEEVTLPVSKLRDTEAFVMTRLRISLLRVTTGTTGAPSGFERVQTFVQYECICRSRWALLLNTSTLFSMANCRGW